MHGVVYGHASGDGASRAVQVEDDFLARGIGFEIEEPFRDIPSGFVTDFPPKEDLAVFQKTTLNDFSNRVLGLVVGFIGE